MNKALIIGATSAIAEATARKLATMGYQLFLVGRNEQKLIDIVTDLQVRGASSADYFCTDLNDFDSHQTCIDTARNSLGQIDIVLISHGTLGNQKACEQSATVTLDEIKTNALSTISLTTLLVNVLEQQGSGTLAVISSVAGDRGRKSNYVFGAAKAMVNTFLEGLRNRLNNTGVHVITIKPGFVDTPMTATLEKGVLWAQPEDIANGIIRAINKQKNIVYLPFFWRYIMVVIRCIPDRIFNRLSL